MSVENATGEKRKTDDARFISLANGLKLGAVPQFLLFCVVKEITSVTQAQVAASNATDDTESLDDPDESRTEDVSSEIFDMSRADFEPEVCDRSSSEEALNNVGEPEALHKPGPVSSGPPNGSFGFRNVGEPGLSHQQSPGAVQSAPHTGAVQQPSCAAAGGQGNVPVSTQQSTATHSNATASATASCSSRFRVIKLDHGTGEPFKRGRWTCTEFYEKDPEGSVISRTVDSIRHPNVTEQGTERDSGLGATGGSVATQAGLSNQGPDSALDSASLQASPHQFDPQVPHGYSVVLQHGTTGTGTANPESLSSKSAPVQPSSHAAVAHGLLPPGHNGLHPATHVQKSPGMASTPPAQTLLYQTQQQTPQQLPIGHHLQAQPGLMPASQVEYGQQHLPLTVAQTHPGTSLPVGHGVSQGPSPVPTPAAGGVLGVPGDIGGLPGGLPLPASQPGSSVPSLLPQHGTGMLGGVAPLAQGSSVQLGQYSPANATHSLAAAPQSATALPVSAGAIPSLGAAGGAGMPMSSTGMPAHAQVPRNSGLPGVTATGSGFGQPEESRRKSDAPLLAPLVPGKEAGKPLIADDLPLSNPAVNSFFGIPIPIDGDDDSASGASVVAIDNKIEQAMDLVKSHLMFAVREEVEVLKDQIKELYERNSVLERENAVLKSLANSEQLSQLSVQAAASCGAAPSQLGAGQAPPQTQHPPPFQPELSQSVGMGDYEAVKSFQPTL
ncbi:TSC22 domain family protein 2 isoform X2 [Electrophorus electricus]|uniref:TSC22 domain family protein 2 isoform X2 n=1 Tax=Electrophorus electricus TaxID=8005 RepID=UPI0015CF99E7|nr:TSC22 domain family protein 2 isoform X2 [Electrophorus electricus]